MTVAQAIAKLQQVPPDSELVVPQKEPVAPDVWDLSVTNIEYDASNGFTKLFTSE